MRDFHNCKTGGNAADKQRNDPEKQAEGNKGVVVTHGKSFTACKALKPARL